MCDIGVLRAKLQNCVCRREAGHGHSTAPHAGTALHELASTTRIAYDALRHSALKMRIATTKFFAASVIRRAAPLAAAVAVTLAACASRDDAPRGAPSTGAIGARLQPIAGGVGHGLITFRPYDGGLTMIADVGGFSAGWYRIAIHMTPICTSPNGFSAGPPLVLPGATDPVVVPIRMWEQGTATLSTRVPGITLAGPTGIEGRSIVLHASQSGPLDATPGVVNDRVACGVIGAVPTLF
jgi:Cu-Zn family superoxide dismutase